jgi:hypothetical protein
MTTIGEESKPSSTTRSRSLHKPVLLVPERRHIERELVVEAWWSTGGEVSRVHNYWDLDNRLSLGRISCYGSVFFCETISTSQDMQLVSPNDDVLCEIPHRWLHRWIKTSQISRLDPLEFPTFAKPAKQHLFRAGVFYSKSELEVECCGLQTSIDLLISEPVIFEVEARAWILHEDICDISFYCSHHNMRACSSFVRSFIKEVHLADAYVLDVGYIRGRGWAVIEANPAWASALRGCSADKIAPCLYHASYNRS